MASLDFALRPWPAVADQFGIDETTSMLRLLGGLPSAAEARPTPQQSLHRLALIQIKGPPHQFPCQRRCPRAQIAQLRDLEGAGA
jgi:hypothetical protein